MKKFKEGYIPYSNEQEREWAIAQAERMGAKKYKTNDIERYSFDSCILIEAGTWMDFPFDGLNREKLVPLERPTAQLENGTPATPYLGQKNEEMRTFSIAGKTAVTFNAEDYVLEHKEDGTIILKPKKKVKVWIEVGLANGVTYIVRHSSKKELEESIELGKQHNETLLEVIEREYEI